MKGRHSYFMVRVSDEPKGGLLSTMDVLVALDAESVFTHFQDVKRGGYVIVDTSTFNTRLDQLQYMEDELKERLREFFSKAGIEPTVKGVIDYLRNNGVNVLTMHYADLLQEVKKRLHDIDLPSLIGRYSNVVMTAYSTAIMGLPIDYVFKGLEDVFTGRRGGKLLEYNKAIVEVVYDYAKPIKTNISLPPIKREVRAIIVNGNEAVAIGKILGGLRFQTYYPITPAADESFFIEAHNIVSLDPPVTEEAKALEKAGIVVVQTEDEISAINMAIGAGIAGARAATATSGPGLSLMVEGTGFAGMNEVPVVITHYQRAGPSTGMATRNSQSDLRFVMHMGHGEFPRIVISSGDHREAIEDAFKALNWAERYQMPVFHLVDKTLANSYSTVIWDIDKKALRIDRGGLVVTKDENDYRRFRITKDGGVSPRSIPGLGPIFWLTGDEHDEFGHITEDPVTRTEMYEKRMKKLELADREIPITDKVRLYGPESADITLVGWGSTKGVLLDVMNMLNREGYRVNFLQLKMFIPFPSDFVKNALSKGQLIIDVESNYDAQAASVIREKTGIEIKHKVIKVTGRPIFVDEVYDAVKKILKDKDERIILMKGP
ncbi:2-oxoacid:ferredoxin oxidoreductase subunit alpha [Vulcanisaeta distributa]|uniref:2-oxoacid:ferredoxin oxidoreductase subunit alpha n=1 Tax=Vulcanisaeta distributa TaxID=164451 RepID=UPI001FB3C0FC|nr:2-oxoacid:ferredoxin oxidoreductase subunit alpha [Vulcanisaeta distributa]